MRLTEDCSVSWIWRTIAAVVFAVVAVAQDCGVAQASPPSRVYGFFTSWSVYARNYHIDDVPAKDLTHLVYMPANVVAGRIALGDPYADVDKFYPGDSWAVGALRGSFRRMQLLKARHPHLRTLISIGGANNSDGFSAAVADSPARTTFVQSIVDFVVLYDFDGVDINWEYPGSGPNPADPLNYTLFLQELRGALDQKAAQLQRKFELTIDVPPDRARIAKLDLAKIAPLVDSMQVMAYDYFVPQSQPGNTRVQHHAPLFTVTADPLPAPYSSEFHVAWSIDHYLALGVPNHKLGLGLALYGRGYAGVSGGQQGLFGTYTGPMSQGTWAPGIFDYSDLEANYVGRSGYQRVFDPEQRAPRLIDAAMGNVIMYEDVTSIEEKAWQLRSRALGAAMVWELSNDRSGKLVGALRAATLRPALSTPVASVSVARPAAVPMRLDGAAPRGARLFFITLCFGDPRPGLPLPGDVLPIALDPFMVAMLGQLGSPLFPGSVGLLDQNGQASASLRLDLVPSLPPELLGQRMRAAAWVLTGSGGLTGEATNALTLPFVN